MAKEISTKASTGTLLFTFTESDGYVYAKFRLNPSDLRVASRFQTAAADVQKLEEEYTKTAKSVEDFMCVCDVLEEKISFVLGYDAKQELFGQVSALTVMEDGELFIFKILEAIQVAIEPELAKRAEKAKKNIEKYTQKYEASDQK